jgi:two-component system sensor histidine kinase DegS
MGIMFDVPENSLHVRAREQAKEIADRDDRSADLLVELAEENERVRRELLRLGFDLHDGPLQSFAAAAADLRHFQSQLEERVGALPDGHKLVGRIDDLVARVLAAADEVRQLIIGADNDPATTARMSTMFRNLEEAYDEVALQATIDAGIDELTLSDSQRICLARVVRGALDNVLQHSGAHHAWLKVERRDGGIAAEVTDDGAGFDPAQTRASSIGLVAMEERVRMLEGTLTIDSQPGGPTTVRVFLPPWHPEDAS